MSEVPLTPAPEAAPNEGIAIEGESGSSSNAPEAGISDIELRARDMGWRPMDDFRGPADEFIDAGEFVRRKPLFDKIETTSKQLKNVSKSLDYLKDHYQKVKITEYNRALDDLKAQHKIATREGEHELAENIEQQHGRLTAEAEQFQAEVEAIKVAEPATNPAFTKWVDRNSWYKNTPYMRSYADEVGVRLHGEGMPPEKVLVEVEKAIKKEFPDKFRNSNRDSAPSVEGSSSKGTSSKNSSDTSFLSEQDVKVMNQLVRDGVLTKEEYIKDMKQQYGVK